MTAWADKYSDEVLDYAIDWTPNLGDDETIVDSQVTITPTGSGALTLDDSDEADGVVTLWLSGGVKGVRYIVTNEITTSSTPPRTFSVPVPLYVVG